jgi:hypothetical protein
MSVLPAARAATDGEGNDTQQLRAPTLITEQEVVFSTSAAASLPRPATPGWRAARVTVATVLRMFLTAAASPSPVRREFRHVASTSSAPGCHANGQAMSPRSSRAGDGRRRLATEPRYRRDISPTSFLPSMPGPADRWRL